MRGSNLILLEGLPIDPEDLQRLKRNIEGLRGLNTQLSGDKYLILCLRTNSAVL